ncbi:MAG: putative acyltransferase [Bacteroidetes bacterium]|nr:putative acyltransferase [Bacteroidota bacterium]
MAKSLYEQETNSINIINSKTKIKGDISSEGDLRIDGTIDGTLIIKGKLVVSTTAIINGNISCQNGDISGKVEGNIIAKELLSLKSNSYINGDITVGQLSIEPGALFTGKCSMVNAQKPIIANVENK